MRLRKALFVLPNLFTVSAIFCGFYACTLVAAGESHPDRFYQAALAILFAIFFDAFDGRVARLTKTQSEFGMQLDSLADVVSFGVAPALLLYKWALQPLGFWGVFSPSCSPLAGRCGLPASTCWRIDTRVRWPSSSVSPFRWRRGRSSRW